MDKPSTTRGVLSAESDALLRRITQTKSRQLANIAAQSLGGGGHDSAAAAANADHGADPRGGSAPALRDVSTFSVGSSALQATVTSLLKAVVAIAEDVKALKHDFSIHQSAYVESTTKLSTEVLRTSRRLADDCVTKRELHDSRLEDASKVDSLSRQLSELQREDAKDKDILLSRIAAQETLVANAAKSIEQLKAQCVNVNAFEEQARKVDARAASLDTNLHERCDTLDRQLQLQRSAIAESASVTKQHEQASAAVALALSTQLDHMTTELASITSRLDIGLTETTTRVARLTADVGKQEASSAQVMQSHARTMEAAVDKRVGEQQAALERLSARWDSQFTHTQSIVDVRVEGIREHVRVLEQDVGEIKSEVAAFGVTSNKSAGTFAERLVTLETSFGETVGKLEERHQRARDRQRAVELQADEKAQRILEELTSTVRSMIDKTEKDLKLYVQTRLVSHDAGFYDTISQRFREEVDLSVQTLVQERMDGVLKRIDEKHGRARERQLEADKAAETKAEQILNELTTRVTLAHQETERRVKALVDGKLEVASSHQSAAFLRSATSANERFNAEMEALRQYCEDGLKRANTTLARNEDMASTVARSLEMLRGVFFVDFTRIPRDPAGYVAYVQSLPWYPTGGGARGASASPPRLLSQVTMPVESPRRTTTGTNNLLPPVPAQTRSASGRSLSPQHTASLHVEQLGLDVVNWSSVTTSGTQLGVQVVRVAESGCGALSGVHVGDVIVALGDETVATTDDVARVMRYEAISGRQRPPQLWLRRDGRRFAATPPES